MRRGRASWTALEIARNVAGLGCDPLLAPLLPAGAGVTTERLLRALGLLPAWQMALARSRHVQRFGHRFGNWLGAHPAHIVLRKRFVDDEVRAALAAGTRQVLVVGAGFDTLALRLAGAYPDRLFVEVDHPVTQASKRAGVVALGPPPADLHFVAADLARVTLGEVLATLAEWDRALPSAVVAEGLLFYLTPEAVEEFFRGVHALTGAGSRVIFTWLRAADGVSDRGLRVRLSVAALILSIIGEPWLWLIPDETALQALLTRTGFAYHHDQARFDPFRRYVEPAGIDHRGWVLAPEQVAVADRVA